VISSAQWLQGTQLNDGGFGASVDPVEHLKGMTRVGPGYTTLINDGVKVRAEKVEQS